MSDEEAYEGTDDEDEEREQETWRARARRARRDERAERRRGGMGVEAGSLWRGVGGREEGIT